MIGIALFLYLVSRVGAASIIKSIVEIGWGWALILGSGGVSHVLRTWAWRIALLKDAPTVSFRRMLALRLASESAGQLGLLGQIGGDAMRVSLLGEQVSMAHKISSVAVDRGLYFAAGAILSVIGVTEVLVTVSLTQTLQVYAVLLVLVLSGPIFIMFTIIRKRWPVLSGGARAIGRLHYFKRWVEKRENLVRSIETTLFDFHHERPGAFWASFTLNMASHALAILEVYLILRLMGVHIGFIGALAIESLTKLVNLAGSLTPGNIGGYEGGNMLIARILGFSASTGLALGICRRVRAIFWTAVGGLCLAVLLRSKKQNGNADHVSKSSRRVFGRIFGARTQASRRTVDSRFAEVIVANGWRIDAENGDGMSIRH